MSLKNSNIQDELFIDDLINYIATDNNSMNFLRFLINENTQNLIKFINENKNDLINQTEMIKKIFKMHNLDQHAVSKDAWSYGQLKSKFWLIKTINEFNFDLGNIWILCGWVGSLPLLIHHYNGVLKYKDIRSFDLDSRCAVLAETLNRPIVQNEWKFKATTIDVNKIKYDDFNYKTLRYDGSSEILYENADTIINTSCEHLLSDEWWTNIPSNKLVILQSNNFFDHDDHESPVHDINEFIEKYPMTELMFTGEIDCILYKRFMIIGRK